MPCDAIATARAKMPVVLPGEVILKLLQSEFPDLAINSYKVGSQLNIYSTVGVSLRVTYDTETGSYEVSAASDAVAESLTTMMQRASAFVVTRLFAKKGQILKAQRVKNATILSLRVPG